MVCEADAQTIIRILQHGDSSSWRGLSISIAEGLAVYPSSHPESLVRILLRFEIHGAVEDFQ